MMYFTGSDYFNRSLRLFAHKNGYSLSDVGVKPSHGAKLDANWNDCDLNAETEEEAFDILGIENKSPSERDI